VARGAGSHRRGELRLSDVELVLQAQEVLRQVGPGGRKVDGRPAQVGPQLVERPEGREARSVLGYAGAASETGFAAVTAAGV